MTTASQTPGDPAELQALVTLALREHGAGRMAAAAAAYRKILALQPGSAEVHSNLGDVLRERGEIDAAVEHYRRAVALKPSLFQPLNSLGNLLRTQGKLDEARACFEQAIGLKPDFAEALNNLGIVLMDQDKIDAAVARFEQALAVRSDLAETHKNLGNALTQQGKFDAAAASYERAISLRPNYAEAHYHRTDVKTFRPGDAEIAALESLAAGSGHLPPGKMPYIHFALGKALEDVGDFPRAFEHLLKGNALKRREVDYDEAACRKTFQHIAQQFDPALFDRLQGAGDPSPVPIFIVGMPRSGSTLVEQILASHPQVHAAGELTNLERVVRGVLDSAGRPIPFPAWIDALERDTVRRLGQTYLANLPAVADGKIRVTDKAPSNFLYVGLIRLILPHARIIHTVRNPVDTCVSCFSKLFTHGQSFSYDLAELGRYYRMCQELMSHWRSVLPAESLLDVVYEDVVDNLEQQSRRLIDHCGLPWDDRCLSFHETNRPITTPSNVQVRRPLYRSSLARWRRYEVYLQPLLAELDLDRPTSD
ncbi:MAG TPA: sulfotransferase [Pirellulales bacterium]|jgi:tetratricopeptide (TPR) repeat protein|nr:sulfotransferase [Pirellulales bacterium]